MSTPRRLRIVFDIAGVWRMERAIGSVVKKKLEERVEGRGGVGSE